MDASSNPNDSTGSDTTQDVALKDALLRIGRLVERVDSNEDLLRAIIEETRGLMNCEGASAALYDPERNDLELAVVRGGAEGLARSRLEMGQGFMGLAAETRQRLVSNDPQSDSRWHGAFDAKTDFTTRNLAAAPMIYAGRLIGVVEAINKPGNSGFSDGDLVLLQFFADQAALASRIQELIRINGESERRSAFAFAFADIGHTVKNILTRLEFPVQFLSDTIDKGDMVPIRKMWPALKRAIADIGALVRDMLNYSKPREPEIVDVDVCALARKAREAFAETARENGIDLTLEVEDEIPEWRLDPAMLKAAIDNLIGNGIDALKDGNGSKISMRLSTVEGKRLQLVIEDDGPGIPPEIQSRIFDPYFSTKKSKGTGLGLANVKKGVEEHGGRVSLASEPGCGARFVLVFPEGPS